MDILEIRDKSGWDRVLSQAPQHDCYHTWDYHEIARRNGEGEPILFVIRLAHGGLLFPLLARPIEGSQYRDLTSVYGYPSPLTYGALEADDIPCLWDHLFSHLDQRGYVSLFSRCHPTLTPKDLGEDLLQRSGPVVIIRLDRPEEKQVAEYRSNHRRDIHKLERLGVSCQAGRSMADLAHFISNYEATMHSLAAAPDYFFPPRYYRELLEATTFDTRIYSCQLDGQVICSGLFIFCGELVQYHLGGTAPGFAHLAPTKLMFNTVRRDATHEGYRHFCLGGGLGSREDSLFRFKAGFSHYTRDFSLIRKIVNPEEYQRLSARAPSDTHYFPRYRAVPPETSRSSSPC